MRPPELDAQEMRAYVRALTQTTAQRVGIDLLTLDFKPVTSLRTIGLDGQIDIQALAEVTRTAELGFFDPDRSLGFDTTDPWDGVGNVNRLIQVTHSLYIPSLDKWGTTTIFTGQPLAVTRDGERVSARCFDLGIRHMNHPPAYTLPKGMFKLSAIREVLRRNGHTRVKIPAPVSGSARLAAPVPVGGPEDRLAPLRVIRRIARDQGWHFFFDAAGYAVVRPYPKTPTMKLVAQGEAANTLGVPAVSVDNSTIYNRALVSSKRQKSKKESDKYVIRRGVKALDATHSYSARSLRSGGEDWINTLYVTNNDLVTQTQVNRAARDELAKVTEQTNDLRIVAVPFFHAEPRDLISVEFDDLTVTRPLLEASLPIFDDGNSGMTIGYQTRVRDTTAGRVRVAA